MITKQCPRCGETRDFTRTDTARRWAREHAAGHEAGAERDRRRVRRAGLQPDRTVAEWMRHPDALIRLWHVIRRRP